MKRQKLLQADGKIDPVLFETQRAIHGLRLALRLAIEETDNREPNGVILRKGCPNCAGYGNPGWIIPSQHNIVWEKCGCWAEDKPHLPYCIKCGKITTANTSGMCNRCLVNDAL